MNFLVIGDSWGFSLPYPNKEFKWLEYNLISKGNIVYNRSVWGNSNRNALADAHYFLEQTNSHIQIDTIIWHYTCLLRDAGVWAVELRQLFEEEGVTYEQVIELLSNENYKIIDRIREKFPTIKWCIIGGHAPVYQPEKYVWADFMISDWRSELLMEHVPGSHSLGEISWLQEHLDKLGPEVVEEELRKHELIFQKCDAAKHIFYDSIHPDAEQSFLLSNRIAAHFNC